MPNKMNTQEGFEMMATMLPHIDALVHSKELDAIRKKIKANKDLILSDIMCEASSAVAISNRAALFGIVSAVTGKSEKEIAGQPLEDTLDAFKTAMSGPVMDFFVYCARLAARM